MSSMKDRSMEIYQQYIALAPVDGRLFRRKVLDQLMEEFKCSVASAATYYNNCKKSLPPVEGLGRVPAPKGLRKPNSKGKVIEDLQEDNDCFSVIELNGNNSVGRYHSFLMQGDASEYFDEKIAAWPNSVWVLIRGLGPNPGDDFKLEQGEEEIKRYSLAKE
jgi:hypothetical protein